MVGTAQSRLCPPYGISSDLNFQAAKREAFESHLTPPLRGEVEIRGSEFRVRGSLQVHGAWREPLTPPSPRKGGAREKRRYSFAISPQVCARFIRIVRPSEKRGRRECRAPDAPAAARVVVVSTRVSHYGHTGKRPAFPHANGFNGFLRALVSAKSARMCERAVLTNRPSLDLSPFVLKGP